MGRSQNPFLFWILGGLIGLFGSTAAIAAERPLRPPHAVTCQAMLLAMDRLDPLARENSKESLSEVREILAATPGREEELARLDELEASTTTHAWTKVSVVATAISGRQAIADYLSSFRSHVKDLDKDVREILQRRYPVDRSRGLHAAFQVMLWSTVASYYVTGNVPADPIHGLLEALNVSFYVVASLGYAYFDNIFVPRKFNQFGLEKHIQKIEACLQGPCGSNGEAVALMSGTLKVPAQFHAELMNRSDTHPLRKNVELTAETAELGAVSPIELVFREFVDWTHWEKQIQRAIDGRMFAPGSPTRNVEYDSLFYVDPKTQEPKLLLFYRSYRQEPKKKPPPDRHWEMETEPQAG